MMCSKGKATFGPLFDQVLQALINTLGPQCICSTGNSASLLVLGTVQVLPRRCMMFLFKSCRMLLSLMNVVPPMAVQ